MEVLRTVPVFLFFVIGQILSTALAMKQVYGVNIGGEDYTTKSGVHLMADPLQQNKWHSNANFGVCGADATIFANCRYSYDNMAYTVPLDGDGRYALGLGFSDDPSPNKSSRFNVLVNGQMVLKKFDMLTKCGAYKTCNQVFYFDVCHGYMLLNGEKSKVFNNEFVVEFVAVDSYAVADAIFVMKDTSDGAEQVFTDGTAVSFDSEPKFSCCKHHY
jgi:Malectin domain